MLMSRQARLQGLLVGSRAEQEDFVHAIDTIGLKPAIDSAYPLHAIADAFRHELSGRHFGKVCLQF
jgi:NADPH:quinone reductase-like Zn-dependent oxidoreductase